MTEFARKTIIVTGSASGIGRATAIRFARAGANVIGGDLNAEGGRETAELCRSAGGQARFIRTDVTVEEDVQHLIGSALEDFGSLDVLFNNAGSGGANGPIENTPSDDWDQTLHILLRSVFYGIKHAVSHMKRAGSGTIVSTASIAGQRGFAYGHAYCAAKAGIINLTRSAAIELAPFGIRVNCVCPGDILTPMQGAGETGQIAEALMTRQPIRRAGLPDDVAGAVLYLASGDAQWITGQSIVIDGGVTSGIWHYSSDTPDTTERRTIFLGPTFMQES